MLYRVVLRMRNLRLMDGQTEVLSGFGCRRRQCRHFSSRHFDTGNETGVVDDLLAEN